MEYRAALDSGDVVKAEKAGVVQEVSADVVTVANDDGTAQSYRIAKFTRSNQGTSYNQRVTVDEGAHLEVGDVIADGPATDGRGTVSDDVSNLEVRTFVDRDPLVVRGALVRAGELRNPIGLGGPVIIGHSHDIRGDLLDDPGLLGLDDVTGVERRAVLHSGCLLYTSPSPRD